MIFISHGVLPNRTGDRISHGLMLDELVYIKHLRRARYVPLSDALAGKGDALTFDDATYAAVNAALIARRFGQPVTLFVNGWHVETQEPYFPFQLSAMLDDTKKSQCFLFGRRWDIRTVSEKRILRKIMKDVYLKINKRSSIVSLVSAVSEELEVRGLERALSTVKPEDLSEAAAAGVSLQSHGWTHLNPLLHSPLRQYRELTLNQKWLEKLTGERTTAYAAPFGEATGLSGKPRRNLFVAAPRNGSERAFSRQPLASRKGIEELLPKNVDVEQGAGLKGASARWV